MININFKDIETKYTSRSTLHNYTICCVCDWIIKKGYKPVFEYKEKFIKTSNGKESDGRIDIAGIDGDGSAVIVCEVDFSYKPGSYKKLLTSDAPNKYWFLINKHLKEGRKARGDAKRMNNKEPIKGVSAIYLCPNINNIIDI